MAQILPFRGILYNPRKASDFSLLMAPPYDVISPEAQDRYYNLHPYNIIRIILGKETSKDDDKDNKYTRAAKYFQNWLKEEILVENEKPAIYLYEHEYTLKHREKRTRRGFIALMKLEDYSAGIVFPHEATSKEPTVDRLELTKACGATFDAVFSLYGDKNRIIDRLLEPKTQTEPLIETEDENKVKHRLWAVCEAKIIEAVIKEMGGKKVFIADGHHRYAAALRFRDELWAKSPKFSEEEPYNYTTMYFANLYDPGLVILPIHRVLRGLSELELNALIKWLDEFFEVRVLESGGREEMFQRMSEGFQRGEHIFGMSRQGEANYQLLILKDGETLGRVARQVGSAALAQLDVTLLHFLLIDRIVDEPSRTVTGKGKVLYTVDEELASRLVAEGKYQVAFFLNPTPAEAVREVALSGERMPHKSTYFYPKLLSGLVMRKI